LVPRVVASGFSRTYVAIRGIGSCKLKLGLEKRAADDVVSAMALGAMIGPLAAVVGVTF